MKKIISIVLTLCIITAFIPAVMPVGVVHAETVTTEIYNETFEEVSNFTLTDAGAQKVLKKNGEAQWYFADSDDSFNEDMKDESGEIVGGAIDDVASFIEYKIKQLLTVTDKTKYEMTFYLSKSTDGDWMLEDLSDVDRQKLHGLYEK